MFALVLFVLAQRFALRGAMRLAQAFLASGFGTFVLFLRGGTMPVLVNVLLANGALFLANVLFYDGVDKLLHTKPRLMYPIAIAVLALLPLTWYTAVDDRMDVRIVLLSITDCLMQVWLLIDLARCARKGLAVYLLGMSVLLSMVADIFRCASITLASSFLQEYGFVQSVYMVTGILAACGLGIFSLVLVTSEIMDSIERSARRDPLTGALNRRGIEEVLRGELDRSKRGHTPLCLALIDIDRFKMINDTAGHAAGDEVLCKVAECIAATLRSYDSCGRLGGDEFLILLPGTNITTAAQICGRMLYQASTLAPHPAIGITPTISVGFTEYDNSDSPESIVARADRALYEAKHAGRNRAHSDEAHGRRALRVQAIPPPRKPTQPGRRRSLADRLGA